MNAEATMMPMTVRQVAEAVQGRLIVPQTGDGVEDGADALATSAVSDSRQVREGSVFVAIAGERVDGHDFVARAGESGAVVALVQHEVDAPVAQIVVPDTVDALGLLAKANIAARRAVGTPFTLIGITGSVGKTTTKDLMAALLSTLGPTVAPVGSFNNEIGLPLTALKVGRDTRFFVAEMGASHVGEITRLTTIAPPDIAVVLKVGCAHLGEFGSVERIAQAKSEIVQGLVPDGLAVLNVDDAHVAAMAPLAPQGHVFWFGMAGDDAEASAGNAASGKSDALFASDVRTDDGDRPSFTLERADGGTAHVQLAIRGTHNVMNALAAASVAHLLGVPLQSIAETLSRQSRISPHRMAVSTVRRGGMSFTLIDDSFNANPDSMRAGLDGSPGGVPMQTRTVSRCWERCWSWAVTSPRCMRASASTRPACPSTPSSRWATMTSISTRWLPPLRRARGSGVTTVTATRRRCIGFTTSIRPTPWSELLPETMTTRLCC